MFQLRKPKYFCSGVLAIPRRVFASKSVWDCLEKGESEAGLAKLCVLGLASLVGESGLGTRSWAGSGLPVQAYWSF